MKTAHITGILDYFTLDPLATLFLVVLAVVALPAFGHSAIYLSKNREPVHRRITYFTAMALFCAAMSGVYLSNHIGMTWIFMELTTITSCMLIYHHRTAQSLEATWKYVFVCSVSIALSFIGVLFMSIALSKAGLNDFTYRTLVEHAASLDSLWLKVGFLFLFCGYTVKAGLFPMFTAGVDAKDEAPTPAAALLATSLCNCGFVAILRLFQIISRNSGGPWAERVMFISALLSVAIATYYMVHTKGYKRLLAYSGVEHIGLATIGLAVGGAGLYAAVLHVVLHSLVKAALFFQFGQVSYLYKSVRRSDLGNYFRINTWGGMVLLLGFFCLTAMPPSGLFVSESLLFMAMLRDGQLLWLIVVMLLLTVIIWSLGRSIFSLLFSHPAMEIPAAVKRPPWWESLSQYILLALVIWWGVAPPAALIELIRETIM